MCVSAPNHTIALYVHCRIHKNAHTTHTHTYPTQFFHSTSMYITCVCVCVCVCVPTPFHCICIVTHTTHTLALHKFHSINMYIMCVYVCLCTGLYFGFTSFMCHFLCGICCHHSDRAFYAHLSKSIRRHGFYDMSHLFSVHAIAMSINSSQCSYLFYPVNSRQQSCFSRLRSCWQPAMPQTQRILSVHRMRRETARVMRARERKTVCGVEAM